MDSGFHLIYFSVLFCYCKSLHSRKFIRSKRKNFGVGLHSSSCSMSTAMAISSRPVDEDEDWGEEEEVVVWSNNIMDNGHSDALQRTPSMDRCRKKSDLMIASLANFAISYNVVNVGLALKIMQNLYHMTETDESFVSAGAILGMMAGQVLFGAAGDCLGRQLALRYTLIVCFIGAVGSALSINGGAWGPSIYDQLIWWRIVLGAGAGGVYPLAATLARASGLDKSWWRRSRIGDRGRPEEEDHDTGSTAVALMFSMQGVGHFAAYLVGFVLVSIFPRSADPLTWRLHLGLGAIPPLIVIIMQVTCGSAGRRYYEVVEPNRESGIEPSPAGVDEGVEVVATSGTDVRGTNRTEPEGEIRDGEDGDLAGSRRLVRMWLSLRDKKLILFKLVGTAGSWFLFDVTFYGNQLYQEDVLEKVFGNLTNMRDIAGQDSILALVAMPGYFVSVFLIDRLGPRFVQVQGFAGMALIFAIIGLSFDSLISHHAYVLMTLYSLTFFFSNFGPNSTTFMLPSLTFPDQVRSSLNGISAASGKFGALIGSLMFAPASHALGVGNVLLICAVVSFVGGLLTLAFVRVENQELAYQEDDDHAEQRVELQGMIPPTHAAPQHNSVLAPTRVLLQERIPLASQEHPVGYQKRRKYNESLGEQSVHATFVDENGRGRENGFVQDNGKYPVDAHFVHGGGVEGEAQIIEPDGETSEEDADDDASRRGATVPTTRATGRHDMV